MRVAVLGMGVIGQRLAAAITVQPDMTLSGVAVRSVTASVLARPELPYFPSTTTAADALASNNIQPRGALDDLLAASDVIVDCGQAGTGAERAAIYRRAGIKAIYCGGERSGELGPLVHSALNHDLARHAPSLRLLSCNTTSLARLAGCVRDDLGAVEATILRCAPNNQSAPTASLGVVVHAGPSHHAADLASMLSDVTVNATTVSVPMSAGHVVHVRLGFRRALAYDDVRAALASSPRIRLHDPDEALDTAAIAPSLTARSPNGPVCRYQVSVRVQPCEDPADVVAWLSLDHAAITIPEAVDAIRGICGEADADVARSLTDSALGISWDAAPVAREAVSR